MSILSVLIFIVCVLLILVVLVQNSKGGGLASGFASNNQIMGVRRTTDFLEKATWGLAGILLILSLMSAPKVATIGEDGNATTTEGSVTKSKASTANGGATSTPATPSATTAPAQK